MTALCHPGPVLWGSGLRIGGRGLRRHRTRRPGLAGSTAPWTWHEPWAQYREGLQLLVARSNDLRRGNSTRRQSAGNRLDRRQSVASAGRWAAGSGIAKLQLNGGCFPVQRNDPSRLFPAQRNDRRPCLTALETSAGEWVAATIIADPRGHLLLQILTDGRRLTSP